MGVEEFFHLAGVDIFATANDDVARTPREVQAAVFAHDAEVAGAEPSVGLNDECRAFGVAIVSLHHRVAFCANLALFAVRHGCARCGGNHFNSRLGHGAAHGFDTDFDGVCSVAHGDD